MNDLKKKRAVHVRLDHDDYAKLAGIAGQLGCAQSSALRMLIRQFSGATIRHHDGATDEPGLQPWTPANHVA